MSGNRFFLPPELFEPAEIQFPMPVSRQICSVLRLKPGDRVTILDNRGYFREVELLNIDLRATTGKGGEVYKSEEEPAVRLALCLSLTQREKFELILQKGTELGVNRFYPLVTSRTLIQNVRGYDEKLDRWKKILQEAAEQCGRGLIPEIYLPQKFPNFLKQFSGVRGYILYEKEQTVSLSAAYTGQLANGPGNAVLLIGPEGGFSPEECGLAIGAGFTAVSLGKRILRMETAAIAACAICMSLAGELGE